MITIPLRILLVEDDKADADHTIKSIHNIVERPQVKVVDVLKDFSEQLQIFIPDVIISNYNLPTCNGLEILELTMSIDPSIPFIFLTGDIDDEELAANTILAGTTGFILKKDMDRMEEKIRPLLKKIVYNMDEGNEIRNNIRKNKIVVNKIYHYLDSIKSDNQEQRTNLDKIRKNIGKIDSNS
jgi:DNA-binding NtrC family response regulator